MLHVAFIVESTHGHINPILGIASELVRRGCKVTCAVRSYFSARVADCGAEAVIYDPLDYKLTFLPKAISLRAGTPELKMMVKEFEREELEHALPQLEHAYLENTPNLIIYDLRNLAGKALASKWGIPTIEHAPMFIHSNALNRIGGAYDETLVIASFPKELQPDAERLDTRFHFIGPIYNSRRFFQHWKSSSKGRPLILVSGTTARSEPEIFRLSISAFADLPYRVVLSIGDEIDPGSFGPLPSNFEINQLSSHLEILEHASLFVYHGGLGSTLEALYCAVPMLVMPILPVHDELAVRLVQLGLGARLELPTTVEALRQTALLLLEDTRLKEQVTRFQKIIRETDSRKLAGDLILGRVEK